MVFAASFNSSVSGSNGSPNLPWWCWRRQVPAPEASSHLPECWRCWEVHHWQCWPVAASKHAVWSAYGGGMIRKDGEYRRRVAQFNDHAQAISWVQDEESFNSLNSWVNTSSLNAQRSEHSRSPGRITRCRPLPPRAPEVPCEEHQHIDVHGLDTFA